MSQTRKFGFRHIAIIITVLAALAYILSLFAPYVDAGTYWYIALLGLGFPVLLLIMLLLTILWAVLRSKWAIVCLIVILAGWSQLNLVIAWRRWEAIPAEKPEKALRVLNWNVSRWDERNREKRIDGPYREKMMDWISEQNADILCFQEFFDSLDSNYFKANIPELQKRGYPYHYFFISSTTVNGSFRYGLATFSKYAIIDSLGSHNASGTHAEGFQYTDIDFSGKKIRVINANLESASFNTADYENLGSVDGSGTILKKLRFGYGKRDLQADALVNSLYRENIPRIVCVDLDDVPHSRAYRVIRGDMQDVFLMKGSGLGRTLRNISPTLRIDYIFADDVFRIGGVNRPELHWSDHYPILTDLYLNDN